MLFLGVLKQWTVYVLIFYTVVDVCMPFIPLLVSVLNASSNLYVHVALLYCFKMRVWFRFTVEKHEILLDHMGTPKWGPHKDNFTEAEKK